MNLTAIIVIATIIPFLTVIPFIFNYQMVLGELTSGDIAQFTPEQEKTWQNIGTDIMLLDSELKGTQNNSTLSNEEIQNQIMEYFIVNQLTYCISWNDRYNYCSAPINSSDITRGQYLEIVKSNQPGPLDGLFKLFGGFNIHSVFAEQLNKLLTQEKIDTMLNFTLRSTDALNKMREHVSIGEGERVLVDTGISYSANVLGAPDLYVDLKDLELNVNMNNNWSTETHFMFIEHEYKKDFGLPYPYTIYSYEGDREPNRPPDQFLEFANYTKFDNEAHDDIINILSSYYKVDRRELDE